MAVLVELGDCSLCLFTPSNLTRLQSGPLHKEASGATETQYYPQSERMKLVAAISYCILLLVPVAYCS